MRVPTRTLITGVLLAAAAVGLQPAVNQAQVAQPAGPQPVTARAVNFAVSRAARELPLEIATVFGPDQARERLRIIPNREVPRPGQPVDEDALVQQAFPEPNMPAPQLSFDGLNNDHNAVAFGFRVSPPDTVGDVGPNHYVQQTNLLVRVFNKLGVPLTAPFKLSSLFAPLGGLCASNDNGDPIVMYDPLADRWILSQFGFTSPSSPPYHECIAISRTPDPAGAYYLYDFITPGDNFPDYPKLGVWPDAYYMTTVQFLNGASFNGSGVFAFDRARMLAGDPAASLIYFDLNLAIHPEGISPLLPADLDGVAAPPAGAPNVMTYFTANEFGDPADALRLFNFHADFAVPANSTFVERPGSPLPVAAFNPLSLPGRDDIPQPGVGTGSFLDAISDRVMHRLQYRHRGGFESLVVNHTVDADPGAAFRAGVRYYELRNSAPGGVYAIAEQATFSPDATNRWMGSAAVDHQGNLAVGYSVSSDMVFPGIRYAGRLVTDPPNGLFQGEAVLINGTGVQTSTSSRWGDYSALTVDPADDCTFWYATEYYTAASQATSSVGWLTRVGTFRYPSCTARATGTLNVNVTMCSDGSAVSNAIVKLNGGLWGVTNASGVFSTKLDPGTYTISASKQNAGSGSSSATVNAGGTTTADVCLSGTVDLTVPAFTAKAKAAAGSSVLVNYTIANSGTTASVATNTKIYLSDNPTFEAADTLVGSDATASVPPGGSVSDSMSANIPGNTSPAVYYLIVRADADLAQPETNEANNTRAKKLRIGPNLVVSALGITPSSVAAGGTVTIAETTKNTGAQSTGASSTTRYYLSKNKTLDGSDVPLGSHAVPTLVANAKHTQSQSVTIPASTMPGAHFILAVADADNVIAEFNESNTKAVPITIF